MKGYSISKDKEAIAIDGIPIVFSGTDLASLKENIDAALEELQNGKAKQEQAASVGAYREGT